MKHFRILRLWAIWMGSTALALGQQANPRAERDKDTCRQEKMETQREFDRDDEEDEDDSDDRMATDSKGYSRRTPDSRNRSKTMVSTDTCEGGAVTASEAFAKDYGITDARDRDELLDAQFSDRKKAEVLEREYSKELRQVLPES